VDKRIGVDVEAVRFGGRAGELDEEQDAALESPEKY
jgi:hypothetical protein